MNALGRGGGGEEMDSCPMMMGIRSQSRWSKSPGLRTGRQRGTGLPHSQAAQTERGA